MPPQFVAAKMDHVNVFTRKIQRHQIKFQSGTLPEKAKSPKKVYYRYYLNGQLQEIILCLQRS